MKVLSKLLSFIMTLGLVGVCVYYALVGESFKVSSIQVNDISTIQNAHLFSAIAPGVEKLASLAVGKKMWSVPIDELQNKILEDSRVENVQISRSLSGKLWVGVSPHIPRALLLSGRGQLLPVSNDGTVLPEVKGAEVFDAPLLRGKVLSKNKKERQRVIQFLDYISKFEHFNQASISDLRLHQRGGLELFLQKNNLVVKLGLNNWKETSGHINQVLKYLIQEGIKDRVIDARFSKKVVVKLRNGT